MSVITSYYRCDHICALRDPASRISRSGPPRSKRLARTSRAVAGRQLASSLRSGTPFGRTPARHRSGEFILRGPTGCRQGVLGEGVEKRGQREPLAAIDRSRSGSSGSAIMAHLLAAADKMRATTSIISPRMSCTVSLRPLFILIIGNNGPASSGPGRVAPGNCSPGGRVRR